MSTPSPARLAYLDHLRATLTVLVIAHHSAIAVGAPGGWYYTVPVAEGDLSRIPLAMFCGVNQAFFMSLFFAIAGFFTPAALTAHGTRRFVRDRFVRLGLPLLAWIVVGNPIVTWLAARLDGRTTAGLLADVSERGLRSLGTGPLWFVLALLIFTAVFLATRARQGARTPGSARPQWLASDARMLGFVAGMGAIAFALRLVWPLGTSWLGLQPGFFPLYVAFFVLGVRSGARGTPALPDAARVRRWFRAALAAMAAMPLVLVLGGGLSGREDAFIGGPTWQALVYAMWEPVVCVGVSLKLLAVFREHASRSTPLSVRWSRSAYTAYILHPFFVVPMTALVAPLPGGALFHFALLVLLATPACFAVSDVVRRAPGLSRAL